MNDFCGLDFGTSNSAMGFISHHQLHLTQFHDRDYIPSSIFFDFDEANPYFGDEAVRRYIDGNEGRIIWSPKNALGTHLISEKTIIKDKYVSFKEIIGFIIQNIKDMCEAQSQNSLDSIVVGRPVFYNDKDPQLDKSAQDAMYEILKGCGFKHIEFEFEPIAAAHHYAESVDDEKIVLVVDMGGGTSDFTIAKLSGTGSSKTNSILSMSGVHIAGTNFDRRLSLTSLMPELGLNSHYKTLEGKWAKLPPTLHKDLATWHKIGFCYTKNFCNYVKQKIYTSDEPDKLSRLLQVLEHRWGHSLAIAVERAKISLSSNDATLISVPELNPPIETTVTKHRFQEAIEEDVLMIIDALNNAIDAAQISEDRIDAVFMTGGASLVPIIRASIMSRVPNAVLVDGDKFGSVATGLTLIASKKFLS